MDTNSAAKQVINHPTGAIRQFKPSTGRQLHGSQGCPQLERSVFVKKTNSSARRLLSGSAGPIVRRCFNLEENAVKYRHIVQGKHTADAQTEEHDTGHTEKKRIIIDDQRSETKHGRGYRKQDRPKAADG